MFSALCAAVGLQALESANIVGYNTKELEKDKFAIAALQFEDTDGSNDINKVVSGLTGVSYADYGSGFTAVAPQIQVPKANGSGYDYYYYLTDGFYVDENGDDAEKPGWCDWNGTIAGDTVAGAVASGELIPGVAVWVKNVQNSGTLQVAGQVPIDSSVSQPVPATFVLRAGAYPVAFDLNDTNKVVFAGLTPGSYARDGANFVNTAPQIQVPKANGSGYDYYYYLSDGFYVDENGDDAEKPGWCDLGGTIAGDTVAGAVASGVVPVGYGFWAKGVNSAFTVTFKK